MTPGFAKSRKELFWLPYPEPDKVIINAHNFTSPFNAAINGKSPVAVWCPSRDSSGNGTSTLYDLVGSNNGALTNMDAATDWVADTGAGGVRALDLDGTNDCVIVADATALRPIRVSISAWFKLNATASFYSVISKPFTTAPWSSPFISYMIRINSMSSIEYDVGNGTTYSAFATTVSTMSTGVWYHVGLTYDGTTMRGYFNGSQVGTDRTNVSGNVAYASQPVLLGANSSASPRGDFMRGLIDDVRLWDQGLLAADMSSAYASGAGRGISA